MVVAVSLHHQHSDNFCKIERENTKWTGAVIYMWRFIVLLSSGPSCTCVLHCSEGKMSGSIAGLLAVESVHLAHSHQHPRQRHWMKLTCWTCDNWLSDSTVEVVTPLDTFSTSLNWTDDAWYFCFVTISVNNQFRYLAGLQQAWPLAWLTQSSLSNNWCKLSPTFEKWNTILSSSKWGPSKKRIADKGLLTAACHHIIPVTLVLCRYTLHTKQLVTHKPNEQSRKNKLCIVVTTSLLAAGTNSPI